MVLLFWHAIAVAFRFVGQEEEAGAAVLELASVSPQGFGGV